MTTAVGLAGYGSQVVWFWFSGGNSGYGEGMEQRCEIKLMGII